MVRSIVYIGMGLCVGLAGVAALTGAIGTGEAPVEGPALRLVEITAQGVTVEFRPPESRAGRLEAELRDLEGRLLAKVTRRHEGRPETLSFVAEVDVNDPANYYLRYRFYPRDNFQQRSLFYVGEVLETTVLGQREFVAGTQPIIRILVRDRAVGELVVGALVRVTLVHEEEIIAALSARTDVHGEVAAPLQMPDTPLASVRLKVEVSSQTANDTVEETIQVRSALRTMLTTDKPLYQPGQTIHIRALTLASPDMTPLADAPVLFEVADAKGNKVFKQERQTDRFGISHADFVLADELNMGTYRVRAIAAGSAEEKTVTVDRYVLPKFKVGLKTDKNFYEPGHVVEGEVQVDYFFGKPVAHGKVTITCSKFDVAYEDFHVIEGRTDAAGHYAFKVRLPRQFVGQPLEAGKASAKFEVKVVDTADHAQTITKNVTVTGAPIIIAAVPESGELVAGLKNEIYIVTTYADATPAACTVTWRHPQSGRTLRAETDEAGFGRIRFTPVAGGSVTLSLTARDGQGQTGKATVELGGKEQGGDATVLLRTNKSLYRTGEAVELSIVSTRQTGSVYVDFIKDRQTYLTRTLDLKNGAASDQVTLDTTLAGTVQINAYLIGRNGIVIRDRRLVIVDPANDLQVSVIRDQASYLPGSEATLTFRVTNAGGEPVVSALGVMVVDEAVFALQEMQPGLEKVYFYLEKEIATPRYEVHGLELGDCLTPLPRLLLGTQQEPRREAAARVLLASAKGVGDYTLHVNTHRRDNRGLDFWQRMRQLMMPRYQRIHTALGQFSQRYRQDPSRRLAQGIGLGLLLAEGFLAQAEVRDPWGHAMRISGDWSEQNRNYRGFILSSPGVDGVWGTADDVSVPYPGIANWNEIDEIQRLGGLGGFADARGGVVRLNMRARGEVAEMRMLKSIASPARQGQQGQPVRIREYFPETLYFNPAVITDGNGKAVLPIPLADSITAWRLSCMASSARGQLGSTTAGIEVFQDFFVDIDFPVSLTQNDQVHVPVAIFNYLKSDQEIVLQVVPEEWFELQGLAEKTVTLGPSEVRAVTFPIVAKKIGFQTFTVIARGTAKSDAVARQVEIVPDGKEYLVTESGRLEGTIKHTITIPAGAIADASKIFVKVYPGVLSQVVEGLEGMLRMPFGCFEQTSSVTYPNVLVLDYMKTTGKITPELQMKAEGFINNGYQRLVSFEVAGGGFEWFGKAPAHRILTAFGLMEFHDMSKVFAVDPVIISRTQAWLAQAQEADGSYKPSAGGIAEGAINKFTDDVFRNTAYITWALASTEFQGPQIAKGVDYLRRHLDEMKDNYTVALAANALATVNPEDPTTLAVLQRLVDTLVAGDNMVSWPAQSATPTHGSGAAADIEVTALAVQAFIRAGRELGLVSKAVTWLVKSKDALGTWQSTQATIQALRAMLMAERGATAANDATIELRCNGKVITMLQVDQTNSDVLQLVDLKDQTRDGANTITLELEGKGALLYQVVGRYYLPYPDRVGLSPEEPLTIKVAYDRTQLAAEDIIGVTATVRNRRPVAAQMVMVDLGLPPGFTLIPDRLNRLVEEQVIEKYSTTGRQIIVYLREVRREQPIQIKYQLLAKYPLKAKTPKSVVYEYYNPDIRAEAPPIELTVAAPIDLMVFAQTAPRETLFTDDFDSIVGDFLATWTVVETGDQKMTWSLGGSTLFARNETTGGGNNQSIIFAHQLDTTGFKNIFVRISYRVNKLDDFEPRDFIRIQGYEPIGPGEAGTPIVENSTEGQWSPDSNPATTPTVLQANLGEYSFDNPNLWVAIEINTSLDRETIFVDSITVIGQPIPKPATTVLFEDFEESSGFTIAGGGAAYSGVAPLSGAVAIPSFFVQGGSQSGNIFYGSFAKEDQDSPPATMTISVPDLTGHTDLRLPVALAAPDGTRWESTHRDSLIISGTTGVIDSFLPVSRGAPLRSQDFSIDLHYKFQDFEYNIDNELESLTFAFASTGLDEVIGIDSVRITGIPCETLPF